MPGLEVMVSEECTGNSETVPVLPVSVKVFPWRVPVLPIASNSISVKFFLE